jgi:mRNA interferase MazF
MKRGDVYWVDLEPTPGGAIAKRRPGVVVSNDGANQAANRVQVVPLTSNTARIRPWEALVRVNGRAQKALADQIRTVAKERLSGRLGTLTVADVRAVEQALRVQLGLP